MPALIVLQEHDSTGMPKRGLPRQAGTKQLGISDQDRFTVVRTVPIPSAPACSGSVGAGRTGAVGAGAVVTGIGAVGALTRVVVTGRAGAIGANADCTRVRTVGALAASALVVVHPVGRGMLPVHMPVVQIVHVVGMEHRCMPTTGAVGVMVLLGLRVLSRRHSGSFSPRRLPIVICVLIDVRWKSDRVALFSTVD